MSRKWIAILGALLLFSTLIMGCAGASKETQTTRCPKCGSYFDSRQGEQMMRYMQGL